ncbi:hypothetical protein ACSMXM_07995 [Pacificimonas sp. ICDLI1SI03]
MYRLLLVALLALFTAPAVAQPAAFDGEELTMASGTKLRRAPLATVLQGNTAWRTVFDAAPFTIERSTCLPPEFDRCLLTLSDADGGGHSILEIDAERGEPIPGGFTLGKGPNRVAWYDDRRIMLVGNSGPGTVTEAGEPRLVKLWTRGTDVVDATTILATPPDTTDLTPIFDVSTGGLFHAAALTNPSGERELYHFGWEQNFIVSRLPSQFTFQDFFQGRAIALLGATWAGIPAGGLASYPMAALMRPDRRTVPERAYVPPAGYGVIAARGGRDRLFVHLRGAGGDRLIDLRVGAPDWGERRISVPGDGPMELLAVSKLADTALVSRGEELYAVGRGTARKVRAP